MGAVTVPDNLHTHHHVWTQTKPQFVRVETVVVSTFWKLSFLTASILRHYSQVLINRTKKRVSKNRDAPFHGPHKTVILQIKRLGLLSEL